jgi:myosin heavy subunit
MSVKRRGDDKSPEGGLDVQARLDQAATVAATLANAELHSVRATLHQYVSLYETAREDVTRLQRDLRAHDEDSLTVVQYLRADLERRDDEIKEVRAAAAAELQEELQKAAATRETLEARLRAQDALIEQLQRDVADRDDRLAALDAFRQDREAVTADVKRMHDAHVAAAEKAEQEVSRLRFEMLEEKVALAAAKKKLQAEFDARVDATALERLDPTARRIQQENEELHCARDQRELEFMRATEREAAMREELAQLRRELSLAHSAEKEHLRLGVARIAEVKELRVRLEESQRAGAVASPTPEKGASSKALRSPVDATQLRAALAAAQAELQQVRKLTRAVLTQRSDTETFFHEALAHVRTQIAAERASEALSSVGASSPKRLTPARGGKYLPPLADDGETPMLDGQLDVARMSWRDRERILRMLILRMERAYDAPVSPSPSASPPPALSTPSHNFYVTQMSDEAPPLPALPSPPPPTHARLGALLPLP